MFSPPLVTKNEKPIRHRRDLLEGPRGMEWSLWVTNPKHRPPSLPPSALSPLCGSLCLSLVHLHYSFAYNLTFSEAHTMSKDSWHSQIFHITDPPTMRTPWNPKEEIHCRTLAREAELQQLSPSNQVCYGSRSGGEDNS